MKSCSRCKISKEYSNYGSNKSTKDGYTRYCKPCITEYRTSNRDSIRKAQRTYYKKHIKNNKARLTEYCTRSKIRYKRLYDSDPVFKLKALLRNRLRMAIKNNQKKGSAIRDLGCSAEYLKKHIESQFYMHPVTSQPMTWDNWGRGKGKWNIDHILEFNHYTNLQPLWWSDHLMKTAGNK